MFNSDLTEGSKGLIPVMVMSGYLTAVRTDEPDYYEVSIPNREMETVFKNKFDDQLGATGSRIRDLEKAVTHGDTEGFAEALNSFAMSMDPKIMSHEHSDEILCISLLMHLKGPYDVQNEIHKGESNRSVPLRGHPLLGTVRAGFPAHGSSHHPLISMSGDRSFLFLSCPSRSSSSQRSTPCRCMGWRSS